MTSSNTTTDPVRQLVESRPWGEVLRAAWGESAREVHPGIYLSPGTSNAYMLRTEEGRVIINTGLGFEALTHKRLFDAVCPGPTPYILVTQGHVDHVGGVGHFRDEGTRFVAQANNAVCQQDDARIAARRQSQSYVWFADVIDTALEIAQDHPDVVVQDAPSPDVTFDERLELDVGARRLVLLSTPGGETVDSCVIHLPGEGVLFTGNLFGPLFPHFPNFNTIRGDKYRYADRYLASLAFVRELEPEVLITGHGDPIVGAALIRTCLDRLEAAVRHVHDETLRGINEGEDIHTLMARVELPEALYVGQGYGRVPWAVRTFWESYVGWFTLRSSVELYPRTNGAAKLAQLAGASAVLQEARSRLGDDPVLALQLAEAVLEGDDAHTAALTIAAEAHRALLQRPDDARNFWLGGWLRSQLASLEERLADKGHDAAASAGDVQRIFDGLASRFVPSAARDLRAVYQYELTGSEAGVWSVVVAEGACRVQEGPHPSPDCRITLAAEDFVALNYGELHPLKAAMKGKLKFEGDRKKAIPLERIFAKVQRPTPSGAAGAAPRGEIRITDLNDPQLEPAQRAARWLASRAKVPISRDGVLDAARRRTGLDDFGPSDFERRLDLLVADYEADDGMSTIGRATVRKDLVRYACNRLLIEDYCKRHPEVVDERVERPLIVAGLPRSGTTHLVNLLAADSRFRSLPLWEAMEPLPNPRESVGPLRTGLARSLDATLPRRARRFLGVQTLRPDPRYVRCAAAWTGMRTIVPHIAAMHPMNPDHVHEELELMGADFASYVFEWTGHVPRYRDHYYATDQTPHYAYMRRVLKVLQHRDGGPRRPWVLKCPQHLEQIPALMTTFPDATVVFTHRDPVAVIQSTVTMLGYSHRMGRDVLDMPALLAYWADRVEHLLRSGVAERDRVTAGHSYDSLFHEFMKDTEGTLDRIYGVYGLTRSDRSRDEQRAFIDNHPRGRDGRVVYDLERQFGMTKKALRERFGFYFERFAVRAE